MTHNNPEERSVEDFWQMMEQNQFVKSTNSVTDTIEEYPPAIVDMEATVSIHGEFDKHAIDDWLHHQLQKAREELLEEMNTFTFEACPYEGTMMRAFIRSKRTDPLPTQVTE